MRPKRINLALQGGGAHGAFSWGVAERLLDEDWIEIAGISGTSAGALNGAAIKGGLVLGGRAGRRAACENLAHMWSQVSASSDNLMVRWLHSMMPAPRPIQRLTEMFSPAAWLQGIARVISPYDTGPFYSNPLAAILKTMPHPGFATARGPHLYVGATNVRSGRIRVFGQAHATADAVMASACLPSLFRAVEIDDPVTGRREAFWDGGFTGNPALFPLYDPALPRDIVIVNINPMQRDTLPRSPVDIQDRVNEVSFNSALMSELRAIHFVKRLFAEGRLADRAMKNVLVHMILDDALMTALNARSKLMPPPGVIAQMRAAGVAAADRFLTDHADALNRHDTVDLSALFSASPLLCEG